MAACRAASLAAEELNYSALKEEQVMAIQEFLNGNVFVILPTGFGKTVSYACLPKAYDILHKKSTPNWSLLLVISPLTALMKDQQRLLREHNINSGHLSFESGSEEMDKVLNGDYNVLYMSPEMLVKKGREILSNNTYKERIVGLIINEAHCIVKW